MSTAVEQLKTGTNYKSFCLDDFSDVFNFETILYCFVIHRYKLISKRVTRYASCLETGSPRVQCICLRLERNLGTDYVDFC